MTKISYNERSWAIDLITEINLFASNNNKTIHRAGGEKTINTGQKRLFPDVLLYGKNSEILMGWELKMPDTPITNREFIENAILKANILGLNSFLLWNVSIAVLYIKKQDNFEPVKTWSFLNGKIIQREEIENQKNEWKKILGDILKDLNRFFDDGEIKKKTFVESFREGTIIEFILRNSENVARNLQKSARKNGKLSAEANIWWRVAKLDYPKQDQWEVLSNIILVNWINKFLFVHILTAFFDAAKKIESIDSKSSIRDTINVFYEISKQCNFWNIFQPQLGEEYLNCDTWSEIKQLNSLLKDVELSSIGQELLQDLLQNIIYSSKRKIAGQYTTPMFLARLLTGLTILDKELSVHDPCCGTGTIARSAYDLKKESGINSKEALRSIFCSDKVAFPLQMATLALTEPVNIGEVIQIFKEDCTKIHIGDIRKFKDPYSGVPISREYNGVDYVVSNLPFIQQEDIEILNPHIKENTDKTISDFIGGNLTMNAKSDLYAYIPFYLWGMIKPNGRLGIIISNSWLATEWGETFRKILNRFYHVEMIIISGKGRWFQNSDVVTTMIILNKRNSAYEVNLNEKTKFITITLDLKNKENVLIDEIVENIIVNLPNENVRIQEYISQDLFSLDMNWNALFSNISWLSEIQNKLISASTLFDINRGERRGWDPMFYPENQHDIENDYIKPVLKSSREIEAFVTSAESQAFCCSKSIEELKKMKHNGALRWIKKFEQEVNEKGEPLPKVLKRSGCYWYEMSDSTMADLVASMNFDKRIFIAKLDKRSFVNQRLTRFTAKARDIDIDLAQALLNSVLGVFFIESIGFGRGLGALDLSSTRMKRNLKMLNPDLLSEKQIRKIKSKYEKLKKRKILPILAELERKDRIEFDITVLETFEILEYKEKIINSLKTLYEMRMNIRSNL